MTRLLTLALLLICIRLSAATYYVATTGNNSNDGSIGSPWLTIQYAANTIQPNDTIIIRSGTYRETITKTLTNVTIQSYDGETVTISGADLLYGWENIAGNYWKVSLPTDLGIGTNQLFKDGAALLDAKWPNTDSYLTNAFYSATEGAITNTTYYGWLRDSVNITQADGYWTGARIHSSWTPRYHFNNGVVTNYAGNTLGIRWGIVSTETNTSIYNIYYLWGHTNCLDIENEWFFNTNDNKAYAILSSTNATFESKVRESAFILGNSRGVTLKDINIFAANIVSDNNSSGLTFDNVDCKYVAHRMSFQYNPGSGQNMGGGPTIIYTNYGNIFRGNSNKWINSTIEWSSGNGIISMGNGNMISNCIISKVNYCGAEGSGIQYGIAATYLPRSTNNVIVNCTLFDSIRSLIMYSGTINTKIISNTFANALANSETWDCGEIYEQPTIMGPFNHEIAYNKHTNCNTIAIYFDGNVLPYGQFGLNVHHNLVYSNGVENYKYALLLNSPNGTNIIVNNTFDSRLGVAYAAALSYDNIIANNIIRDFNPPVGGSISASNNLDVENIHGDLVWQNWATHNYMPKAGGLARFAGVNPTVSFGYSNDIHGTSYKFPYCDLGAIERPYKNIIVRTSNISNIILSP
jgi:hypothetical protein